MAVVHFTRAPQRHVEAPTETVEGATVREVLDGYFAQRPEVRGYVLDERGMVRKHVAVFVAGEPIADRDTQSDAVGPDTEIHVMQALSGG
ncbi:MAG: MoaD/ThiS family protein [Acidimicrobiia bacterium]